jgi:hypothetical protein
MTNTLTPSLNPPPIQFGKPPTMPSPADDNPPQATALRATSAAETIRVALIAATASDMTEIKPRRDPTWRARSAASHAGYAARGFGPVGRGNGLRCIWKQGCHQRITICTNGPHLVCIEEIVKKAARRPGKVTCAGDGCLAATCKNGTFSRRRYHLAQVKHALALIQGSRVLTDFPEVADYDSILTYDQAPTAAIAAMILARELSPNSPIVAHRPLG